MLNKDYNLQDPELAAVMQALTSGHAEYVLIQDDMQVAGCEGPAEDAWREIQHYAATYREEGPVRIERVLRIPVEVE